jgi:transmembrane serine protease 9
MHKGNNENCYLLLPPADSCTNPSGRAGTCLNIKQCPALLNLLRQQRQDADVANFLRNSACGYEGTYPKVCCAGVETRTTEAPPENSQRAPVREAVRLPDLTECGIVGPEVKDIRVVGGYPAELGKCSDCCWMLSDNQPNG